MSTHDISDGFEPGGWEFTPEVVAAFDAHIRASVPFYDEIQDAVSELSDWLAPDGATLVDLGISTGETFRRILDRHKDRIYPTLIGYDLSAEMLEATAAKIRTPVMGAPESLLLHNRALEGGLCHTDADLTLCLFTLQFVPPEERPTVLRMARVCSADTGALLLAEKVRIPDSRFAEIANEVSWDWKYERGISSDAIRTKARALRGVLRPATGSELGDLIVGAGWSEPTVLFRWHQWVLVGAFAKADK